mgnify:CR=1 FL=1
MPFDFTTELAAYIARAKLAAQDGLTLREVCELIMGLVILGVRSAESFTGVSGPDKKAAIMDAAGRLFDTLAPHVLLPPPWSFVATLALKVVRPIVLHFADGAIEAVQRKVVRADAQ